jgi:hypothetical protein
MWGSQHKTNIEIKKSRMSEVYSKNQKKVAIWRRFEVIVQNFAAKFWC